MLSFESGTGSADDEVLYTSQDVHQYVEHIFRATAGAVTVQAFVNGAWTTDLAFEDMESTTPSTFVLSTNGNNLHRIIGRFNKIRFLQDGVTGAKVVGSHNAQ